MDTGQLTLKPICPICRKVELTDQELAMVKNTGTQRCWYCLVDALVQTSNEQFVPDPAEFGRPTETKDNGIQLARQKLFRPVNVTAALKDMVNSMNQTSAPPTVAVPTVPGQVAPPQTGTKPVLQMGSGAVPLSEDERKAFILKFGADPVPQSGPYEITVHGAHEDLYLKFSCPTQVDIAVERELKRLLNGMLGIIGKLLKFGPQFAATLIELQALTAEMFLGGK